MILHVPTYIPLLDPVKRLSAAAMHMAISEIICKLALNWIFCEQNLGIYSYVDSLKSNLYISYYLVLSRFLLGDMFVSFVGTYQIPTANSVIFGLTTVTPRLIHHCHHCASTRQRAPPPSMLLSWRRPSANSPWSFPSFALRMADRPLLVHQSLSATTA